MESDRMDTDPPFSFKNSFSFSMKLYPLAIVKYGYFEFKVIRQLLVLSSIKQT